MNQGIGYGAKGSIDFNTSGPANNRPGSYPLEKTDWSPRISIAFVGAQPFLILPRTQRAG